MINGTQKTMDTLVSAAATLARLQQTMERHDRELSNVVVYLNGITDPNHLSTLDYHSTETLNGLATVRNDIAETIGNMRRDAADRVVLLREQLAQAEADAAACADAAPRV